MKRIKISSMILLFIFTIVLLASCGGGNNSATLKLTREFNGMTFSRNGIEEVDVTTIGFTDGDTSRFTTKNSRQTITIRYLSIDTPESTAGYEKWGKAASVWNKSVLSQATSIVIEAKGSTPELDSNGTRYLAYVWYKTKDNPEYVNYNLECVRNGFSLNNCAVDDKYYSYFQLAENTARAENLRLHNDNAVDSYYNEDINNVTIKQLVQNPSNYYDSETEIPKCVAFDAYVVSLSTSQFVTATVEQFSKEDNRYYQYHVEVGYNGTRLYTITNVGTQLHFVGWVTGSNAIHGCKSTLGAEIGTLMTVRMDKTYYNTSTNMTISSVDKIDNKYVYTAQAFLNNDNKNLKTIEIEIDAENITQQAAEAKVGKITYAKLFSTGVENKYSINILNDLTK